MEIEFYGAAGHVTGSCHILRVGDATVLLDCGMIQGGDRDEAKNADPFPFDTGEIDAVILSHAHIDHSGRLPLLVKRGFRGPIHTQNATQALIGILLADSADLEDSHVRRENRHRAEKNKPLLEPLYTQRDVDDALELTVGHKYREHVRVAPGITLRYLDAGHIMGSTVVELTLEDAGESRVLVFSGDLGQYDSPILRDPESPPKADRVIMECTYGDRRHRERAASIEEMGRVFHDAWDQGGNVLIPAFAVGRSQELLYHLGKHYEAWGIERWQIFLDSPLAIEASEIYW
ncbi:MAG: MBL fold metallo-hydrolase, partial [Pseudomonadales bacterium]